MTMSKVVRKKLFVDEHRIWNLEEPDANVPSNMTLKIRSILMGYMRHDVHVENLLNIRRSFRNLAKTGLTEKNNFLRENSRFNHKNEKTKGNFYSKRTWKWTVLIPALSSRMILNSSKIRRDFAPKFYHEKRARNFLKYLVYVGEHGPDNTTCEYRDIGRKYYEYKKSTKYQRNRL